MSDIKLIDVSRYQGEMDWEKAKPLIKGAYLKVTEGTGYFDPQFKRNLSECKRLGIPVGGYHYFHPNMDIKIQADNFMKLLGELKHPGDYYPYYNLPPMLDVESADNCTQIQISNAIKGIVSYIEFNYKVTIGMYTRATFWDHNTINNMSEIGNKCLLWVANYGVDTPRLPKDWKTWTFWQYSADENTLGSKYGATGSIPIDLNKYNGTIEQYNEQFKVSQEPPPPVLETGFLTPRVNNLRIRNTPTTVSTTNGYVNVGDRLDKLEERKDNFGNDWVRIGWKQWVARRYQGKELLEPID